MNTESLRTELSALESQLKTAEDILSDMRNRIDGLNDATKSSEKVKCVDCDGNEIFVGDTLALMDAAGLSSTLYRGRVFIVDGISVFIVDGINVCKVEIHPTSSLHSAKPSDEKFHLYSKRFLKIIL